VLTSARQEALRNLTSAGVLTVVPAGFASTAPGSVDPLDACSIPVAASELALSVSATDEKDAAASGAIPRSTISCLTLAVLVCETLLIQSMDVKVSHGICSEKVV
jgi:hypothetical protein